MNQPLDKAARRYATRLKDVPTDGFVANELLTALHRGASLDIVLELINAKDQGLAGIAAWIAQELGCKARPLLPGLVPLLTHTSAAVRYELLDVMLVCATSTDIQAICKSVALLTDAHSLVRQRAMNFVFRASTELFESPVVASMAAECREQGIGWEMARLALSEGVPRVKSLLDSSSRLMRGIGAGVAGRLVHGAEEALWYAAASEDADVAEFAWETLGRSGL